jgi:Ca2+/Na+ antiporter
MGLLMVLIKVVMHDHHYNTLNINNYIFILFSIGLMIYIYRNQIKINDKEYLKGMIEHHSMALLTSNEILKKTNDYNVAKLAKDIIETQNNEINKMKDLLDTPYSIRYNI